MDLKKEGLRKRKERRAVGQRNKYREKRNKIREREKKKRKRRKNE